MNEKEIITGFIKHETLRGIKNIKKLPYLLKPFFKYLKEIDYSLFEITFKEAQEYQTYLTTLVTEEGRIRYTSGTIADLTGCIKSLYRYLKQNGKVYSNPFENIKGIKKEKNLPKNIPNEEKLNELLKVFKDFWKQEKTKDKRMYYKIHIITELMYSSGLRVAETAALELNDIDFENKTITVKEGKGGYERIAYLNEYALKVLKIYLDEMKDTVNVNKENNKIFGTTTAENLCYILNKYLGKESSNLKMGRFHSHKLRHSLGFHLLRRGCDLRYIQLILGHKDMNSTTIYTKVEKKDLRNELDTYHPRRFRSITK